MLVAQRVFKVVRTDLHEKYDHPCKVLPATDATRLVVCLELAAMWAVLSVKVGLVDPLSLYTVRAHELQPERKAAPTRCRDSHSNSVFLQIGPRAIAESAKAAKVAVPPLGWSALQRYLAERRVPTSSQRWDPGIPLVGSLDEDSASGITAARLWAVIKRFFRQAVDLVQDHSPSAADKLRKASTHWMRRARDAAKFYIRKIDAYVTC